MPDEPEWLDWDLWLGPAPARPYHKAYHPAGWRRWWDFGGGTLGDMACHYMDLAFWALDLQYPTAVHAKAGPVHAETTPRDMVVHYEFPERSVSVVPEGARRMGVESVKGAMLAPPVKMTWYDDRARSPKLAELRLEKWKNGVLFVGDDGWVIGDYSKNAMGPSDRFADFKPPKPWIPDSVGHYKEWVEACKQREKTSCAFSTGASTHSAHHHDRRRTGVPTLADVRAHRFLTYRAQSMLTNGLTHARKPSAGGQFCAQPVRLLAVRRRFCTAAALDAVLNCGKPRLRLVLLAGRNDGDAAECLAGFFHVSLQVTGARRGGIVARLVGIWPCGPLFGSVAATTIFNGSAILTSRLKALLRLLLVSRSRRSAFRRETIWLRAETFAAEAAPTIHRANRPLATSAKVS